uniref:Serine aminopeptidase S33 domain-containing protein n=1 Tax=Clastoptera arizonana TaxID=38151 RepID=A0A1B6D7Z0_9HEMI
MAMNFLFKRRFIKRICLGIFITGLVLFTIIFVVIPCAFKYSYMFQRSLLFLNFVKAPHNIDYNKPSNLGLIGARNFYLTTKDNVKLGVWHTLPVSHQLEALTYNLLGNDLKSRDAKYNQWLKEETVFIYMHGNAGTRAFDHRVQLYKILNDRNYHVIAFDYRGYGDSGSAQITDEAGVVTDAKTVIDWVLEHANKERVFVWGHSLGTGIASHSLAKLEGEGKPLSGLVLEAPFNNLSDEIREYPMSQMFKFLPWFDYFFVDPVYENHLRFENDVNLKNVSASILILHAVDDRVVPFKLGHKLYETIRHSRKNHDSIKLIKFGRELGLGHKFIFKDKNLPGILSKFVSDSIKGRKNVTD